MDLEEKRGNVQPTVDKKTLYVFMRQTRNEEIHFEKWIIQET